MTAAPKLDARRRALYGKIEIAKKQLALDDETYRALLQMRYGKGSRKALSNVQLVDLVEHLKEQGFKPVRKAPARAGRRPLADGETQRKIRALWISLYHLGVVSEPAESALAAFVKRQAGVDDLRWLAPDGAYKVIEALKAWASRAAGVLWEPDYHWVGGKSVPVENPRARVMEAQWRILFRRGVVKIESYEALSGWAELVAGATCRMGHGQLPPEEADRVIEKLGAKIRRSAPKATETAP